MLWLLRAVIIVQILFAAFLFLAPSGPKVVCQKTAGAYFADFEQRGVVIDGSDDFYKALSEPMRVAFDECRYWAEENRKTRRSLGLYGGLWGLFLLLLSYRTRSGTA